MTIFNATPFATLGAPSLSVDGREVVIAVVKATFTKTATGRVVVAEKQAPVRASDVAHDPESDDSSIRYPGDVSLDKRGTDVVLVGHAVSRTPAPFVDVCAKIKDRVVILRVHGKRLYYRGAAGVAVGPAVPFQRESITYENAFGGKSQDQTVVDWRNPVGRGIAKNARDLVDAPAPQIEHPAHPIQSARDQPEPVGFGAVSMHWKPRSDYAGTRDAAWVASRMPLMPLDYDPRHNNVAHASLQFDPHLVAGDALSVQGMTEEGLWQAELPRVNVALAAHFDDGRKARVTPPIDTVLVEPEKNRFEITMRYVFPMGRGKTMLREVRVYIDA
jgi:hypothetical protein